jgi:hypothetical protein
MVAHDDHCRCEQCGTVCHGLFPACKEVWAAGPKPVLVRATQTALPASDNEPERAREGVGRPTLSDPTAPQEQAAELPGPKVSLVTPVSPNPHGAGRLPVPRPPGTAVDDLSSTKLKEFAQELHHIFDEAGSGLRAQLQELEERIARLEASPPAGPNGLELRLSEMQGALATLSDQWSYMERVLGGLRADVASLLVLQRWAVSG